MTMIRRMRGILNTNPAVKDCQVKDYVKTGYPKSYNGDLMCTVFYGDAGRVPMMYPDYDRINIIYEKYKSMSQE